MYLPKSIALSLALGAAALSAALPAGASADAASAAVADRSASAETPVVIPTVFSVTKIEGYQEESYAYINGTSPFAGEVVVRSLDGKQLGRQFFSSPSAIGRIFISNRSDPLPEVLRIVATDTKGVQYAPVTLTLPRIEDYGKLPQTPTVSATSRTADSVKLALGSQLAWNTDQTIIVRGPDGTVLAEIPRTGYNQTEWVHGLPATATALSVTLRTTKTDGSSSESRPALFAVRAEGAVNDEDADPDFQPTAVTTPGALTPGAPTTVAGTATPGAQLIVLAGSSDSTERTSERDAADPAWSIAGSASADAQGGWSVTTAALAADVTSLKVIQVAGGNVVETDAAAAPAEHAPLVVTSPTEGSTVHDAKVTFTGTAEPGTEVAAFDHADGAGIGQVTAAADGTWTLTTTRAFPNGQHTVDIEQLLN